MSILHDGMCALEESTIIIIITNHLSNYYFFTYMYVCHHVEMIWNCDIFKLKSSIFWLL